MAIDVRITQQRVETVGYPANPAARITQHAIEQLLQPPNTQAMRCTQHAIEILLGPAAAYTDGGFESAAFSY